MGTCVIRVEKMEDILDWFRWDDLLKDHLAGFEIFMLPARRIVSSSKRFHIFQTSRGRPCKWERGGRDRLGTQVSTWLTPVSVVCAFCKSTAVLWSPDVVRSSGVLRVKTVSSSLESLNVSWISFCTSVQSSLSKPHDRCGIPNLSIR